MKRIPTTAPATTLSTKEYAKMEPFILPLVRKLNELGIATISSCEGHPDRGSLPYIIIDHEHTDPNSFLTLVKLLAKYNSMRVGTLVEWMLCPGLTVTYGTGRLCTYLTLRHPGRDVEHIELMRGSITRLAEALHLAQGT